MSSKPAPTRRRARGILESVECDMEKMRKISLLLGGCKNCEACIALAPEAFAWDENTGKPRLVQEWVTETQAQELIAYCPEDCIEYDDE